MSEQTARVLAGDCTVRFEDGEETVREERGAVLAIVKPDDTVLVHDNEGYRPAAWLTRADGVSTRTTDGTPVIDATDGDRRLVVTCHDEEAFGRHPLTGVGPSAGGCPDCGGPLVRTPTAVECLGCHDRYGIPRDASLQDTDCETCGLPTMRVERGDAFTVCVDRGCESLDERVRDRFDRAWGCPACGSSLRILRRGGLIAGCDRYPDCDTAFQLPQGMHDADCEECGLPAFTTDSGRRCLDAACAGP